MTGSAGDKDDDIPDSSSDRPHEPDEPELPGEDNPGERLIEKYDPTMGESPNPEEDLAPDSENADVPEETARLFWYLVTVFNLALVGLAVGLMVIVFLDRDTLGVQITLAGAILFAYGYYRYRKHVHGAN